MSSGKKFEMRSLIIIVPFAAAFLIGCLFICKHKMYLWTLRSDDSESDGGPKVADANAHPKKAGGDGVKYPASADLEAGNMRGAESESDSILIPDSGKGGNRKSLCA